MIWKDLDIELATEQRNKNVKKENWKRSWWYRNFVCYHEWVVEHDWKKCDVNYVKSDEDSIGTINTPSGYNVDGVDSVKMKCTGCGKRKYLARSIYKMLPGTRLRKSEDRPMKPPIEVVREDRS